MHAAKANLRSLRRHVGGDARLARALARRTPGLLARDPALAASWYALLLRIGAAGADWLVLLGLPPAACHSSWVLGCGTNHTVDGFDVPAAWLAYNRGMCAAAHTPPARARNHSVNTRGACCRYCPEQHSAVQRQEQHPCLPSLRRPVPPGFACLLVEIDRDGLLGVCCKKAVVSLRVFEHL